MHDIRIHVVLAGTLMLVGCYSVRHEHVELSADNIEVTDVARPNGGGLGVDKGKIPMRYALVEADASLTFAMDANYGRGIQITSSAPIAAVSTTLGLAVRVSPFEYAVEWATPGPTSRAGQTLEIRIELEQRSSPIVVSGVVETWGRFYHPADL
jgi:hypothetical protein